ncbi:EpsG family protein [Parabacteroides distasonis]|uniref:EpsG family protein n=1 Tax=Parabacteroides distasonis TaxID=823 RepID=UPI00174C6E68|nr:EpsG family protein [Parabacteroides distasonis]
MKPIYSIEYSIPYLLLAFLFLSLSYYEYKRQNSKCFVRAFCVILFLFFYGFRGFVGWDWQGYYPIFEAMDTLLNFSSNSFFVVTTTGKELDVIEPGYIIYQSIIKTVFDNWHFFILISVCIDALVLDRFFCRYSPNYAFSFFVLVSLHSVLECDLLRNVKAIMIFLISIDYLYKRKWFVLAFLTILGVSFHRSYLLYLPFYFIGFRNFGLKFWLVLFVAANFIYLFRIPIVSSFVLPCVSKLGETISDKVDAYAASDIYSVSRGFTLGYFMRVFLFLAIIYKYDKIIADNKNIIIVNLFLTYVIANLGMTEMRILSDRMELSIGFVLWIILPLLPCFYTRKTNKKIIIALVLFFCIFKVIILYNDAMWEYENVLFGAVNYDHRYATHRAIAEEIFNDI